MGLGKCLRQLYSRCVGDSPLAMKYYIALLALILTGCIDPNLHRNGFHYGTEDIVCRNNFCCIKRNGYTVCAMTDIREVIIYIEIIEQ
jgi:hypothetical protein